MGGNNTRRASSEQLEVDNFGQKELVDFKMNIFLITEENKKMKYILNLLNNQKENVIYTRDKVIKYYKYEGFIFRYLEKGEKDEEEKIEEVLKFAFDKINNDKMKNNTFIIYFQEYKKEDILKYLKLFLDNKFEEGDQPFILFLTDESEFDEKKKQEEIRNMVKEAAKEFVNENYKNKKDELKIRLEDLNPDDYYQHYNIFLIKFEQEIKKNNNDKINKDIIKIYNKLIKFASSYNEIGDDYFFDEYEIENAIDNHNNNNINKNKNKKGSLNDININNINNISNINNINNINNIINTNNNFIPETSNDDYDDIINTDRNIIKNESIQSNENNIINKENNINKENSLIHENKNNGEIEKEKSYNFINIFCAGRTGTGKSTFINTFCDERKCNIGGGGLSKTKRINVYTDHYNHIRLYDIKGFEDEITVKDTIKLLQRLEVELINCKQKIHLVLYFLNGNINFHKNEFPVFNQIVKYNSHIIFIKTFSENDSDEIYQEEKKKLYDNISQIFKDIEKNLKSNKRPQKEINDLRDLYANIKLCETENFVLANLRRKKHDWFKKVFGMEKICKAIHDYFKNHIIKINNISKIEDLFDKEEDQRNKDENKIILHPIYTIIKNNIFLKSFKTINDILSYVNQEKKWIIARYTFYAFLSGINPVPFVDLGTYYLVEKRMKIELAKLYQFDLEKNLFLVDYYNNKEIINMNKNANIDKNVEVKTQGVSNIGKGTVEGIEIGIKISNNIKNIGEAFINSLKSSFLFTIIGCLIGGAINVGIIIYYGNKFSEYFEKNLTQDRGVKFLMDAAKDYNDAIHYFEKKSKIKDE